MKNLLVLLVLGTLILFSCSKDNVFIVNENVKIEPVLKEVVSSGKGVYSETSRDCENQVVTFTCNAPYDQTCFTLYDDGTRDPDPFEDCETTDATISTSTYSGDGNGTFQVDLDGYLYQVDLIMDGGGTFYYSNGTGEATGSWCF